MTDEKTETEKQWLSDVILPEVLKNSKLVDSETLRAVCSDEFHLNDIKIRFIGYEEAFMLTICYRATISYRYKDRSRECHLVVKKTPQIPEEMFNAINFGALFSNEVLGYAEILPAFEKFAQTNLNVCRCFYGNLGTNHAEVVLEDFASKGFRVARERYNLSLEHTLVAVKYLARFHSLGFAMRQKDPELYESLTSKLRESRFTADDFEGTYKLVLDQGLSRLAAAVEKFQSQISAEFRQLLFSRFERLMEFNKNVVKPREPYVTLCHGDYLRNNIAFKYATENDTEVPVDVMMFDMQTLRSCSPMIDLSIFLALSTLSAVRQGNFERIFSTYVDELRDGFKEYSGQAAPDFLGYDALLKEYVRFLPYSVSTASSFLYSLVDPLQMSSEEMLMAPSDDVIIEAVMKRGGAVVDQELAHQVAELYELSQKYEVEV